MKVTKAKGLLRAVLRFGAERRVDEVISSMGLLGCAACPLAPRFNESLAWSVRAGHHGVKPLRPRSFVAPGCIEHGSTDSPASQPLPTTNDNLPICHRPTGKWHNSEGKSKKRPL
ncbi:MAG: hypothetical protein JNL30_09210 [Rubrivivax sp.]|nr:hypothetical protein [Rubrivivax sp.]